MPRRDYDEHRERSAERQREKSKEGRDIAPLPEVEDPRRRKKCEKNFRLFCETYFPRVFTRGWSPDHLRVIKLIEQAVLDGLLQAIGMPRGSGKSSLCQRAALWAILYGHHRYVVIVCADDRKARKTLGILKTELETNDLLAADFPEVCHAIRKLERIPNRAKGQLYQGESTRLEWGKTHVILPRIPGSVAAGAILEPAGLESAVRGAVHLDDDGNQVRPSLALVDDPQTRRSAKTQNGRDSREQLVSADLLGMAGPGESFSCLMPCTVIYPDDMADRMLNREKHPEWRGVRAKLLYAFPDRMDLWEKYAEILRDDLRNDGDGSLATAFYKKNRKAMDKGAKAAWEERKLKTELSAIQHAMNLYLRNPEAFASEYQNEPIDKTLEAGELLSADEICLRLNKLSQRQIPLGYEHITAFIDVQKKLLYWLVAAWRSDFSGAVLDYGAWPDQKRHYFSLDDARPTLLSRFPGHGLESRTAKALTELTDELFGRLWKREDGAEMRIDRLLIDANWGDSTEIVYQFCRRTSHGGVWPSHGRGITASGKPFSQLKKKPGETIGDHWMVPQISRSRAARHVLIDTNYWKSFVHHRLAVQVGDPGSLSLWGNTPRRHRMLADHLLAEFPIRTSGRGREIQEWKIRPERPDNHLFDCLFGAAVAASMLGVTLGDFAPAAATGGGGRRPRVSLKDLRRKPA